MTTSFDQFLTRRREQLEEAQVHAAILSLDGAFADVIAESDRTEFRVSVLGRFKRGKSTVLNALVGTDLLPTDVLECTSALIEVRAGQRQSFHELVEGSARRRSREDFLAAAGGAASDRKGLANRWEVRVPSLMLAPGMVFVDTPGTGGDPARQQMAMDELKRTDAALFVLSAQQLAGLDEINDLRELQHRVPIVVVLINQMDLIPDARRDAFLEQATARLAKAGIAPTRVLPFSARDALRGDARAVALLDVVRRSLSETLLRNTAGARLGALQGSVEQLLRSLEPRIDAAVAASVNTHRDEQRALRDVEQALATLERELAFVDDACRERGRSAAKEARRTMKAAWPGVIARLEVRRSRWKSSENPFFSPRDFARDIAEAAREDLLKATKEVVTREVQPVMATAVEEFRAEIGPHVSAMLAAIGRLDARAARQRVPDDLFEEVMESVIRAVDDAGALGDEAASAAIGASVAALVTQMIAAMVSTTLAGFVALPVLVAVVLGALTVGMVMGRAWVDRRARDAIADAIIARMSEADVQTQIADSVRDVTRQVFVRTGEAFRTRIDSLIHDAQTRRRRQSRRVEETAEVRAEAVGAARAARNKLHSIRAAIAKERERLDRVRTESPA